MEHDKVAKEEQDKLLKQQSLTKALYVSQVLWAGVGL